MKRNWIKSMEEELEGVIEGRIHRWSFLIAVLVIGGLFSILSENVTVGPSWILLVIMLLLCVPLLLTIYLGQHVWTRILSLTMTGVLTLGLLSSVIFLVYSLFHHSASALVLFRDAFVLWSSNVVLFGIWYWEVDQGGPIRRHVNPMQTTDFLFPQSTTQGDLWATWKPSFIDYLFLAFNTSTAFSPTDTLVMSKRAKVLMITQASISLVIVAVLAARAINIIN
ncbi:hypothetical protein [Alicyclobacillus ferrooxydans]|nr:hypothetical protein [Alicyclobacillus ferrooxydans]